MKPIVCFGEAIIDFLNTSEQNEDLLQLNNYRQYPGGAPANAAVAVAKLGGNAFFAGQVGNDPFGAFLIDALKQYQVHTDFVMQHATAKTALAFVMLDNSAERSFSFYRQQTADILVTPEQVNDAWFTSQTIFHICSNTLTDNDIAQTTEFAVNKALSAQCVVSFDVNLRHNLWQHKKADRPRINRLVMQSHIIKFSLDELHYLADDKCDQYITDCLSQRCELLLITDGSQDIKYYTKGLRGCISPPQVNPIDTTAGGDGFIGGLLFALGQSAHLSDLLESQTYLEHVIAFASLCGAFTVTKLGAFPALPNKIDILNQSESFIDIFSEQ